MLLRTMGQEYERLLAHHHAVLRAVWREWRGVEVNTEGDAFFVAFESAGDAVNAAAAAQRAIATTSWPTEQRPLVRIGVHSGWARPVEDDYVAMAVNQAARIVSAAHGGQTLVSDETAASLSEPPIDAQLIEVGRFRVRDFPEPVMIHRLDVDDIDDRGLAPRVLPADGHNLVRPTTTFHSRADDLEALRTVVLPGSIVSIVGPGGVGKTRLAIEHGLVAADAWDDGVWFVDLARTAPGQVDDAVATAIGATNVAGRETRVDLLAYLRDRSELVVLDNCEHVRAEAAQLAQDIIALAPACGILTTSRVSLGLLSESVHRLAPLDSSGPTSPAVELFIDRAGPAACQDLQVVERLCRALDGLPLSIELAASRAASLGPELVLDRLSRSVSVIKSNDPSLPERHRTLHALLEWTWDVLDDESRSLLTDVCVLPAGFTLFLIERTWEGHPERSGDPLDPLSVLLDHALITRAPAAGDTRYVVPASVRTYTAERSADDDLLDAALRFGALLGERLGPERATSWRWLSDVDVDIDNLRAIIRRIASHDDVLGQRLAWSIGRRHDLRNAFSTGIHELADHLELLPTETPERTAALALMSDLALRVDQFEHARSWLARAESCRNAVGAPSWDNTCVERTIGELALRQGHVDDAIRIARDALTTSNSPRSRARLLNLLGLASGEQGSLAVAVEAFRDELAAEEEGELELMRCTTRSNLAEALLRDGDTAGAAWHQLAVLDEARANQDLTLVAFSVLLAGQVSLADGRPADAHVLHSAGSRLLAEAGIALLASDLDGLSAVGAEIAAQLDPDVAARADEQAAGLDIDRAADRATDALAATAIVGAAD